MCFTIFIGITHKVWHRFGLNQKRKANQGNILLQPQEKKVFELPKPSTESTNYRLLFTIVYVHTINWPWRSWAQTRRSWITGTSFSCRFDFIYPNFYDRQQVQALIKSIRQRVKKPLLITVDQEGGRVQRFREGFHSAPCDAAFAALVKDSTQQQQIAKEAGWQWRLKWWR